MTFSHVEQTRNIQAGQVREIEVTGLHKGYFCSQLWAWLYNVVHPYFLLTSMGARHAHRWVFTKWSCHVQGMQCVKLHLTLHFQMGFIVASNTISLILTIFYSPLYPGSKDFQPHVSTILWPDELVACNKLTFSGMPRGKIKAVLRGDWVIALCWYHFYLKNDSENIQIIPMINSQL